MVDENDDEEDEEDDDYEEDEYDENKVEMIVKKSRIVAPLVDSEDDELVVDAKTEDSLSITLQTQNGDLCF